MLAVTGLMLTFGLQAVQADGNRYCSREVPGQLAAIHQALEDFLARNKRYPRPAIRNLGANHAAYGNEVSDTTDPGIARIGGGAPVLIGALPHGTLGLGSSFGGDCWGNQFTYAITEAFTTTEGYGNGDISGGIRLRRGTLAAPLVIADDAAYVVLSHGAKALGASPASYAGAARACNAAAADASVRRIDKENCDTLNATFFQAAFHPGEENAEFFDDYVVSASRPPVAPPAGSCAAETIRWGDGCEAPALVTLGGLSVPLTNIANGYTGTAVSVCNSGVRTTVLGVCLPVGLCSATNPRTGDAMSLLTGVTMQFGTGVCKRYACCNGSVSITPLSPCPLLDLPGLNISCP